jgi:hypothetical protein
MKTKNSQLKLYVTCINMLYLCNINSQECTNTEDEIFRPCIVLETWGTYSINEEEYKNRTDFSLRRLRFGAGGKPQPWLSYDFQLHADRLGQDKFAATKGAYKGIGIWNAYLSAKVLKNNELLNIHAGYLWAAVSREFINAPWAVSSFDKTMAVWYLRSFITGKGNGIESGIAAGGMANSGLWGLCYRIGTYEPEAYNSGDYSDRLFTGRIT